MASELKVNTLTGVSTAGSIAVTAEGNSTTTNLQGGLCKAWIIYNKTDDSITDSLNVSGDTDNAGGDQTISYTNNMATAKGYHAHGTHAHTSDVTTNAFSHQPKEDDSLATSSVRMVAIFTNPTTSGISDRVFNSTIIVGDLA
jgi:hypothetical protein